MSNGMLFVVSGPSGTGKTSLVRSLVTSEDGLVESRSYTARSTRPGEMNGVDYHFVSRITFDEMVARDEFLEWANVFGNLYGTASADTQAHLADGVDVVLVIDVNGARHVRESKVDATSVFVLPPSPSVLESRLRGRGRDTEEEIQRRLDVARDEVSAFSEYDYVIVNDDFDATVEQLRAIVVGCRAKLPDMEAEALAIATKFVPR
tara:strand:+ start:573 stop:1190 length:618 start_codon:yes stop_codon:yes gene_type:complete